MKGKSGKMNVRRRLGALVLALALALALVCVPRMETKAAPAAGAYLTMTEAGNNTSVPLEIGDTVSLQIAVTGAVTFTDISEIYAELAYEKENFEVVDIQGGTGWKAIYSDSVPNTPNNPDNKNGQVSILSADASPRAVTAGEIIATITLRVKRAVVSTTIHLVNGKFLLMNDGPAVSLDTACNLTNSMNGSRSVEYSVPPSFIVPLEAGETASLPFNITSNTGFNVIHIKVSYNGSLLQYDGWEPGEVARAAGVSLDTVKVTYSGGFNEISLCFISVNDVVMTGEFIHINFLAGSGANAGIGGATVTTEVSLLANESLTDVAYSTTPMVSTIQFSNDQVLLGDVNLDGKINLIDAAMVLQYYNGVRTFDADQEKRADVNKSKSVTLVDALLIMKMYNGEITTWPGPTTP